MERQLGRNLALAVVYLSGLTVLAIFLYVALHGILGEIDIAVDRLTRAYAHLTERAPAAARCAACCTRSFPGRKRCTGRWPRRGRPRCWTPR